MNDQTCATAFNHIHYIASTQLTPQHPLTGAAPCCKAAYEFIV